MAVRDKALCARLSARGAGQLAPLLNRGGFKRLALVCFILFVSIFAAFSPAAAQGGGTLSFSGSTLQSSFSPESSGGCSTIWDSGHVGWSSSPPPTGSPFDGTYCSGAGSIAEITSDLSPITFITEIDVDQTNFDNGTHVLHDGYCQVSIDGGLPITAPANPPPGNPLPTNSPISGINENATNIDITCFGDNADNTITTVVIHYTGAPPSLAPLPTSGPTSGVCQQCTYAPVGDWFVDAPKLVEWLYCQIQNLFACWLIPILLGLWQTALDTLHAIAWSRIWIGDEISVFGAWANDNTTIVSTWANGEMGNLATQIANAIYGAIGGNTFLISGNNANFWDVLVSLFNNLGGVIGGAFSALPSIIHDIANVILAAINGIVQIAMVFVALGITLVNFGIGVINEIISAVNIIPAIVGTFQAGFNVYAHPVSMNMVAQSATIGPPTGGPTGSLDCTNGVIYHVCIGLYMLDNTVFQGDPTILGGIPIFADALYMSAGLVAANAFLWMIRRFRGLTGED